MDLSLLLPVIGLIFTVVSKLLLLYSTIDKTSTLKMKSFSTMRVTQRGSQRYMEKRRGRRELEVTRRRRGAIKRGKTSLARNQFPKVPGRRRGTRGFPAAPSSLLHVAL